MAKTFKKFLALALVLSLVMGMTGMAYAADEPTEGAVAENVEIINGAQVAEDENIEEEPAPVEDSTTVGTIPTENGEPVTSVVEEVVAAEEVGATAEVDTAEALAEALANNSVKLIQLTANINITSQIDIKRDLTLNGNGHTLTYTNSDSETSHISAIQIWGARVLIRDLSIEHNTGAALIVNGGADVTADKLTTSSFDSDSRLWGGVNVDGHSRFTAYSLTCNEAVKVWSEDAGKGSTVSIDGYVTVYGVDGAKVHFTTEEVAKSNPAVKAEVGGNYYGSLQEAINAATSGQTVTLLKDTNESSVLEVKKSITINGDNHKVTSTANRILWVDESDVTVTLNDIEFVSDVAERGVQVNPYLTGVTLNINHCVIPGTSYAVNICGNTSVTLNIDRSTISGWGALNLWGNNYEVKVTNSTLNGHNDKGYNADGWNGFGTIVLEGDTTDKTDEHVEGCHVVLENCKITATTEVNLDGNANTQKIILFNSHSKDNVVEIKGNTTVVSYEQGELTPFCVNNGDGNTIAISGGTFTSNVEEDGYVANGYVAKANGNDTWTVVPNYVARAGANDYMTIAEAIAAGNGHTVTLLRSTTENVVIPADKTVTLEIPEGITLSNTLYATKGTENKDQSTIVNYGNLTVTGEGTVLSHCAYSAGVALRNHQGATATLKGCTFINDNQTSATAKRSYYTIHNYGTMEIFDGTKVVKDNSEVYTTIMNGWHSSELSAEDKTNKGHALAKMTIHGVEVTCRGIAVQNSVFGDMIIENGTFKESQHSVENHYKLVINGGTFTSNDPDGTVASCSLFDTLEPASVVINGGTFTNVTNGAVIDEFQTARPSTIEIKGGSFNGSIIKLQNNPNATIAVSGGDFSIDPREYVISGYRSTQRADERWIVSRIPTTPIIPSTPDTPDEPIGDIEDDETALGDRPFIFEDVHENDWFYDEVKNIFEHGLINGTTTTTYEPQTELTRGMIVTILWRIAGEPTVETASTFTDVPENAYYFDAVNWGAANNIARGYDEDTFAPDRLVSREELAALIYRYAELVELDLTGIDDEAFAEFGDAESVLPWFVENMKWAINAGIVKGEDGNLLPQDRATRAEAAAMVNRFIQIPEIAAIMQANAEAETTTDAE